jgi:diphthine-ammonia ligase
MSTLQRFFCSWSGGKDSCLALYRAIKAGDECASLFSMIDESGTHSRSHGLPPGALLSQARSMGIPLRTANASWGSYEMEFRAQAARFSGEGLLHGGTGLRRSGNRTAPAVMER